ncbi:right-handed parallel beta-helix repeat-containing protein [Bremerella sp. JC770]|uniref:right-handed parallel beta-helix repeat-containing protein n=1 Tax=Bremerella sp. JC770 TaxID=3232137 RepID=UPI003458C50D
MGRNFISRGLFGLAATFFLQAALWAQPSGEERSQGLPTVTRLGFFDPVSSSTTVPIFERMHWWQQSGPKWNAFAEFNFSPGNAEVLGDGLAFIPLWQNESQLLFADVRGLHSDKPATEANWGMGFRSLDDNGWILGGYGFFDRRWEGEGYQFDQVTLGAEFMSYDWDFRVNGYIPTNGTQGFNATPTPVFTGSTIALATQGAAGTYGMEFEVGRLLATWRENNALELRGFLGAYRFDNNNAGIEEVIGPRARLELRSFEVPGLPEGSRLTANVSYQWDQVREEQISAGIALRIPLRGWGRRLDPLQRRMLDRVVRDRDIVTQEADHYEPAKYADTGELIGEVDVFDANSPNLAQQIANSNKQVIILDGSQGALATAEVLVLGEGKTLRGAGFEITGAQSNKTTFFGARPTVDARSVTDYDSIELGNGTTLRDVDLLAGSGNGVGSGEENLTEVTIENVHVSQAGEHGFGFYDFSGSVRNSQAIGSGKNGFRFSRLDGTVEGNLAEGNGNQGYFMSELMGTLRANESHGNSVNGFDISQVMGNVVSNTATGNGENGFRFSSNSGESIVANNVATSNDTNGFHLSSVVGDALVTQNYAGGNGRVGFLLGTLSSNALVEGNSSVGNVSTGFYFNYLRGNARFEENESLSNGEHGYRFSDITGTAQFLSNVSRFNAGDGYSFSDLKGEGVFSENVASNNGGHGVYMLFVRDDAEFSNNVTAMNGQDGVHFYYVSGNASMTYNESNDNSMNGFSFLDVTDTARFAHNTATSNVGDGFQLAYVVEDGVFTQNTAADNGGNGFDFINVIGNAAFTHNTAERNTLSGFNFSDIADADMSFNAARENGGDGFQFVLLSGTATFTENESSQNGGHGFAFDEALDDSLISDNQADFNNDSGFVVSYLSDRSVFGVNTAYGNGGNGINIFTIQDSAQVIYNESNENDEYGFNVFNVNGNGQVQFNEADSNGAHGFLLFQTNPGTNVSSNTSQLNGQDVEGHGFYVLSGIRGAFTANHAEQNSGKGYSVSDPGPASGNTGTGNDGGSDSL